MLQESRLLSNQIAMKRIQQYLAVASLLYFTVASAVWMIRNPTANEMTPITEEAAIAIQSLIGRVGKRFVTG
jgi:hypothetical protein